MGNVVRLEEYRRARYRKADARSENFQKIISGLMIRIIIIYADDNRIAVRCSPIIEEAKKALERIKEKPHWAYDVFKIIKGITANQITLDIDFLKFQILENQPQSLDVGHKFPTFKDEINLIFKVEEGQLTGHLKALKEMMPEGYANFF